MSVSSSRLATRNEQLYLLSVHSSSLANSIACTVRAFFFTIRGRVFGAGVVVSLSIGLTAALSICFLPTTALLILLRDCILLDICLFFQCNFVYNQMLDFIGEQADARQYLDLIDNRLKKLAVAVTFEEYL